jgi:hypothetical protein
MLAARSLLVLVATLAVVGLLWLTLLSGGSGSPTATPGGTSVPSGATDGAPADGTYNDAIGAAGSAVQQSNQDAQRAAESAGGAP